MPRHRGAAASRSPDQAPSVPVHAHATAAGTTATATAGSGTAGASAGTSSTAMATDTGERFGFEVFYDGACPLCRREIDVLRRWDAAARSIVFTDIAEPDFDALAATGLSQAARDLPPRTRRSCVHATAGSAHTQHGCTLKSDVISTFPRGERTPELCASDVTRGMTSPGSDALDPRPIRGHCQVRHEAGATIQALMQCRVV